MSLILLGEIAPWVRGLGFIVVIQRRLLSFLAHSALEVKKYSGRAVVEALFGSHCGFGMREWLKHISAETTTQTHHPPNAPIPVLVYFRLFCDSQERKFEVPRYATQEELGEWGEREVAIPQQHASVGLVSLRRVSGLVWPVPSLSGVFAGCLRWCPFHCVVSSQGTAFRMALERNQQEATISRLVQYRSTCTLSI